MALESEAGRTKPAEGLGDALMMDKKTKDRLREFVRRAEQLKKDADAVAEDRAALDEEIDEVGLDKKMVKRCVKARELTRAERDADQEKFEFYMTIIGDDDRH